MVAGGLGPFSNEDHPPDQNGVGGPGIEIRYREDTLANYGKGEKKTISHSFSHAPLLHQPPHPLTSGVMAGEVVRAKDSDVATSAKMQFTPKKKIEVHGNYRWKLQTSSSTYYSTGTCWLSHPSRHAQ